jgi:hypothetical protein
MATMASAAMMRLADQSAEGEGQALRLVAAQLLPFVDDVSKTCRLALSSALALQPGE